MSTKAEECDYCGCLEGEFGHINHFWGCPVEDPSLMDSWREGYMAALDGEDCHKQDHAYLCGWTRRIGEALEEQASYERPADD